MAAIAIPAAIAGVSALANYFGNKPKPSTTTSEADSTESSAGTNSRNLLAPQRDAIDAINQRIRSLYNPANSLEPIRAGLRTQVNARYAGLPQAVADKTLTHGAASGQFGGGVLQGELARLGDLGVVDTNIAQMGLDQQHQGDVLAQNLLSQNFGSTINSNSTSHRTGKATGINPGNPLAAFLGSGAESASNLYRLSMLDKLLRGSSAGGTTGGFEGPIGGGTDWGGNAGDYGGEA